MTLDSRPKWYDSCPSDVRDRLLDGRSIKSDILPLAQAKWDVLKHAPLGKQYGLCKDDALAVVMDYLNCLLVGITLTKDEHDDIVAHIV